jgi:hypothetical protein
MSVKDNQLELINTQPFLEVIDTMSKAKGTKKIVDVSKSMHFADECSVVELYWNPESATSGDTVVSRINNLGLMLNGVLIYHRGRLITRYLFDNADLG